MNNVSEMIERILPRVRAPARYIGGEWNSVRKDLREVRTRFAIAFPDTYEIGMSCLATHILYDVINRREDCAAERVFAPWPDMEAELRENGVPLFSLENRLPLSDFHVVGFTLQHEMSYTNVLNMLDLGGIPMRSADRGPEDPLVVAGGPGAFQPEPMADFVDVFLLGDGEEIVGPLVDAWTEIRAADLPSRRERLLALAQRLPFAYVPALYRVAYHPDDTLAALEPAADGVPAVITKALVQDFENAPYPTHPVVPFEEGIQDRITLEIMRGCPYKCRFCQSTSIKHHVRHRSVEKLVQLAEETYRGTGYAEISLTSLSTTDYPHLPQLMAKLSARFKDRAVSLSLPSLRVSDKLRSVPSVVSGVRKAGFTLAPETASERLRRVLGKRIHDADLLAAARIAYQEGWRNVKLYFLIGIPGETEDDALGILKLSSAVSSCARDIRRSPGSVNVTISPFVPKPHTPFQWDSMPSVDQFRSTIDFLRRSNRNRRVRLKAHDPGRSFVEAVFARGDRRVGSALLAAWRGGCRFDAWTEQFSLRRWEQAFAESDIDAAFHASRQREFDELLPWSHIDVGIPTQALRTSREKAESDAQMEGPEP